MSYHSIPEDDDDINDDTSDPGTPSDNKPTTASSARGHTLKQGTKPCKSISSPAFNLLPDFFHPSGVGRNWSHPSEEYQPITSFRSRYMY